MCAKGLDIFYIKGFKRKNDLQGSLSEESRPFWNGN